MNKPYQEISLLEFHTKYQTEEDCEKRLFKLRWPQGFACPSCGHREYYHVPLSVNCIGARNVDIRHL